MLMLVGEQFGELFGSHLRGAVYARRKSGDRIGLWVGFAEEREACLAIGVKFRELLNVPGLQFNFEPHNDSMADARKGSGRAAVAKYHLPPQ